MLSKFSSLPRQDKVIAINQVLCWVLVLSALPNVTKIIPWIWWDWAVLFFWLFFPVIVFSFNKEVLDLFKQASIWTNILILIVAIIAIILLILIAL